MRYSVSATAANCSDVVAQSSGVLSGLTTLSVTRTLSFCSSIGHMLYFADAQQGTLSRVSLLPISTAEVYVQKTGVNLQDNTYYSAYILQETSSVVMSPLNQPVVLLSGVNKISSLSLDLHSK